MRIQEVESKTGLTRANIRFYEKENLIEIDRKENGYRDYSEENVDTLLKIKLLRQLNITIDDIRDTQQSKIELSKILEKRQIELVREMKDLEKSKLVCQEICEDGTSYQQLDARKYLSLMEKEIIYMKQNHMSISNNIEKDVIKHKPQPWRRYFARQMDYVFYGVLWEFIFSVLFRQRYQLESGWIFRIMVMFVPTIILMVFIEPLFLSIFGTTPGKWVSGISIMHGEGRKLTYKEGLQRIWKLIRNGEGFYVPIYRECRIYEDMGIYLNQKKRLPWDELCDCEYTFKDSKAARIFLYIAVDAIFIVTYFYIALYSMMPIHRGNISLEEFSANYNDYLDYYGIYGNSYLDKEGKWQEIEVKESVSGLQKTGILVEEDETFLYPNHPQFQYKEKNGVLTEVSFDYILQAKKGKWVYGNLDDEIIVALYSFACAQPKMNTIQVYKFMDGIKGKLENGNGFSCNIGNVEVDCNQELDAFESYKVTFSMKLQ